jgi:hypothetical protein
MGVGSKAVRPEEKDFFRRTLLLGWGGGRGAAAHSTDACKARASLHTCMRYHHHPESAAAAGEVPNLKDWESHLTTIFPEVCVGRGGARSVTMHV